MRKNNSLAYAILGIAFLVFNVLAFAIPVNRTTTFWISYTFTTIAFILQILIWKMALKNAESLKSKFLGIPIIHIGIVYLIIQLISFAIFMGFPEIQYWVSIIVSVLILGISAMSMTTTQIGKNEINRVEEKVTNGVSYIKELQIKVEMMAEKEEHENIKESLRKLAEKIRFSDPMSNETLEDLEKNISNKVAELEKNEIKEELILEIDLLLTERNKKIKILK